MQLQPNQGNLGLSLCESSRASEVVLEIGTLSRNLGTWGGYLGTLDASILMRARSRSMGSRCVVACCIGREGCMRLSTLCSPPRRQDR